MSTMHSGREHRKQLGRYLPILGACALAVSLAVCVYDSAWGQQVHRNGFETKEPAWIKGPADVPFKEAVHDTTDQTAHSGQLSEHIQLTAEVGNYIHYHYPTAQAPLGEELAVR